MLTDYKVSWKEVFDSFDDEGESLVSEVKVSDVRIFVNDGDSDEIIRDQICGELTVSQPFSGVELLTLCENK